ncbi:Yip1-like protein [Palleronia aestuarii]|uniref:Yip1-like protein n=1 Tax=Palleronia aestuarii TaxID=568105 RepID=A0A2W7Q9R5_9RHOB|nr:YIP1 family protein [Palleronia aestuarii]PZX18469.1 Yip1-like protein [Palleronia aestuarii]
MNLLSFSTLLPLAGETLRAPRRTFARLMELPVGREALWQALLLVVVLSILLAEATNLLLFAAETDGPAGPGFAAPFIFGAIQFVVLLSTVFLIDGVGRKFGGTGDLRGALLAVTWLQFIMVCLQVVQSVVILLVPSLGALVVTAGLVLFLVLLTCFVAELHGFSSLGRVFGMILFVLVGVGLALSLIATLAGVTVSR